MADDFDTTTNAASSAATETQTDPRPDAGTPPDADAPELVAPDTGTADASAETPSDEETDEPVPFHEHPRWQQVQRERQELKAKLADLEPFADIVAGFKEQGYTDAQAVRAAIEGQQQEAQAQEASASEETWRSGLAASLLARTSDPDDEMTYGEAEATFRAAQLERDLSQRDKAGAAARAEGAEKALATQYPQMDAETVRDLLGAGLTDNARRAAERTHTQAARAAEKAVADYNAKRASAPRPAEGAGGGASVGRSLAAMSDAEFLEYDKRLTRAAARG